MKGHSKGGFAIMTVYHITIKGRKFKITTNDGIAAAKRIAVQAYADNPNNEVSFSLAQLKKDAIVTSSYNIEFR